MTNEKVLVCGDVDGNFKQLFKRVNNVNQKNGPFSLMLCVGEFFGVDNSEWIPYKTGKVKVPFPIYILGPENVGLRSFYPDMRGCELAENIIYLGPSGIYQCSSGLRIAYLSGTECKGNHSKDPGITFDSDVIKTLKLEATNKPKIDILITSQWPRNVCNFAKSPEDCDLEKDGSTAIAHLAYRLQPRYHFAGSLGVHYERLPYRNHRVLVEASRPVTRFIGLSKVGNAEKKKWLYAFNIAPMNTMNATDLVSQPDDVTECPYNDDNTKLDVKVDKSNSSQFFYDMNAPDDSNKRKRDGDHKKRAPPKPTGPCWFCLASPEVEKHLIVSVGTHCYLALAKGGLVLDHLLILPVTHLQSTCDLDDDCREEIEKFKAALKKTFASKNKKVVFFERNYKSQHLQIQVIPFPRDLANSLKDAFLKSAESCGIELNEIPKLSDIVQIAPPGSPYFYLELPNGEKMYHRVTKGFPLHFGREVMAGTQVLNLPDRIDWRDCKLTEDSEIKAKEKIRSLFKPYDFTLESDSDSD